MAHRHGARVLVDGAQAVSHMPVDVQSIDCDWYAFSGHKVYAPTGIGVLYGKRDAFEESPPWQGGGNMIVDVTFEKTVYQPAPMRFEAGTGSIGDAVGLGAALDYVSALGMENVARHEQGLLEYGMRKLLEISGLRLIGTAPEKAGVMSFVIDGFRNEEIGAALDREGVAVRAGHHCAQPAVRRFGQEGTVRPSLGVYNTQSDIDVLAGALRDLTGTRGARRR
jgi:cysteine desulfurase/selenocysteine lyase